MAEETFEFERDIHTIEQLRNDPELCFAFGLAKSRLEIPLGSITRIAKEAYEIYASIECSEEEKTEFLYHLASGNFGIASSFIHKLASSKARRSQDNKGSVARINSVDIRPNPVYSQAIQAESKGYQTDSHTGQSDWNEAVDLQVEDQGMFERIKERKGPEGERKEERDDIWKGNMRDDGRIDKGSEERARSNYDYSMGNQISYPSSSTTPFNIILWNKPTTPQPLSNYDRAALLQPTASSPYLPQDSTDNPQPIINQVRNVQNKDLHANQTSILYPTYTIHNLAFNPQSYLNKPSSFTPSNPSQVTDQPESRSPLYENNPQASPSLAYIPPVQPQPFQNYQQPTSDLLITNPKGDSMSIDNPQPSKYDHTPSQINTPHQKSNPMSLDSHSSSSSSSIHPEEMKQEDHIAYTFSSPDNLASPISPSQPPIVSSPSTHPNPPILSDPYPPSINTSLSKQFPIVKPIITPGCNMDEISIKIEDTFREVESSAQSPEHNMSIEYEFMNEPSSEVLQDIKLEESMFTLELFPNLNPIVSSYNEEEKTQPKSKGPTVSDFENVWHHLCYLCKTSLQSMEARTLKNCGHRFHSVCFDNQLVEAQQHIYKCPIPECSKLICEEAEERKEVYHMIKSEFIVCPGINCGTTLVRPQDKGFVVCDECKNVVCLSCEKVHSDWYSCKHNLKIKS